MELGRIMHISTFHALFALLEISSYPPGCAEAYPYVKRAVTAGIYAERQHYWPVSMYIYIVSEIRLGQHSTRYLPGHVLAAPDFAALQTLRAVQGEKL